jgi:hypothetical protein
MSETNNASDQADNTEPELRAELLRRRKEALAHPEKLTAWEIAFPLMKQRFDDLRRKNPRSNRNGRS